MPPRNSDRTSEQEIAVAVLRICADSPSGTASIAELKRQVPDYINLTEGDRSPSQTRNGEELWEQIVRNIVSHKDVEGNIIAEGYAVHNNGSLQITDSGRAHLKRLGY